MQQNCRYCVFSALEMSKLAKCKDGRFAGCLYRGTGDVAASMVRDSVGVMESPMFTLGKLYVCQNIEIHQVYFK